MPQFPWLPFLYKPMQPEFPCDGFRLLDDDQILLPHLLSRQMIQQGILEIIKEDWLHDIIAFNVLTGLRLGEIMNLKWSDYDSQRKEITIQSSNKYCVKGGKMRTIPIGEDAAALLDGRTKNADWIFVGERGKKYTDDYVSKKFKEYVRQLGLPEEIHYHRLRDTYCTWLAEQNVPVHIIKALAGHTSIRVTEKYISPNTDVMKQEVAKIQLPKAKKQKKSKQ